METRKRLEQMKEMEGRNAEREKEFAAQKVATIHRTVEIYARSTLDSLDILAQHHQVDRKALLEMLIATMMTMEHTGER